MAIADLVMPKLGESIMEATILKWHKHVGDKVQLDETILDIATDKVDSEVPSTAEGVITEILFQINDVVPIGTVIARIQTGNGASVSAAQPAAQITAPEQTPAPATSIELAENFFSPKEATEEAEAEIPFTPSQPVVIAEPTLAKPAINRFYSPLVLNIANSEGVALSELETIPGTGNEGRVTKKDILQYVTDKKAGKVQVPAAIVAQAPAPIQATARFTQAETKTEPAIALPVASVSGKLSDPAEVVLSGATEIQEMDRMRKLIAKHMVQSVQTSPHVTSFAEADVTNMVVWRNKVKDEFERREGAKLTFTPMFIECLVEVLKKHPLLNCSLDGENIVLKKDINIGMATALPSGNLIVPVIKGADQLNIVGLSKYVNQIADAARNNKLKPEDTKGGTFTLTNVGTFGSLMGTPIINQPQVAILAVGAIKKRPVVLETAQGDTIAIRHMMYLSMSYDHRIIDGSLGAGFLTAVAKAFENWDPERKWFQYL